MDENNKQVARQNNNVANNQASYEAKGKELRNRFKPGSNPGQVKIEAKKFAIKKGVTAAAAVAGVPPAATESMMSSEKADEILTEAAAAGTVEQGIEIVVKKLIGQRTQKYIAAMAIVVLAPFMLILMMIGKYTDGFSYVQGEKIEGYEQLYEAVDKVSGEVSSKYNVSINKYLIISTMTAVMDNDNYSNETNTSITVNSRNEENELIQMSISQLENKVRILAMYQIETGKPDCSMPSNTKRQIAANDDAAYSAFSNAADQEKNYNCNATEESYTATYEEGSIDNENSGGVFFWNLVDENFLEEYYQDAFKDLKEEEKKAKKAEYVDYIYLYAKMLEEGQLKRTSGGSCEYDNIIVKLYECETPTNSIFNQNPDPRYYIESLPFEEYMLGVTYFEAGINYPREYMLAQNIASRTYTLGRTRYKPGTNEIHLRSCTLDHGHCNYKSGCSAKYNTAEIVTIYSDMKYSGWSRPPVTDQDWLKAMNDMRGVVLKMPDGSIKTTPYRTPDYNQSCREGWCMLAASAVRDASSGMTYEQILRKYYSDDNFVLSSNCKEFGQEKRFGERGQVISGDSNYMKTAFISNVNFSNTEVEFDGVKIDLNKNSSGPASLAMIVNALSKGFAPLFNFFSGVDIPLVASEEIKVVAMMHRYLYKISQQEEFGSSKYSTYDNRAVELFNIKSLGEFKNGNFSAENMKEHLMNKRMILAHITDKDCPVGTDLCQGLGSTSGSSFAVIFGYNKATNKFMLHNPSSYYGAYQEIDASIAEKKINSITVYEGKKEES